MDYATAVKLWKDHDCPPIPGVDRNLFFEPNGTRKRGAPEKQSKPARNAQKKLIIKWAIEKRAGGSKKAERPKQAGGSRKGIPLKKQRVLQPQEIHTTRQ